MGTKKIYWWSLTLFLASSFGCLNEVEPSTKRPQIWAQPKVSVEVRREEPVLAAEPVLEDELAVAPVAAAPVVAPLEIPNMLPIEPGLYDSGVDMRYARHPFADNSDIPPWRANYVGSYGVLPTRFNDEGPFMYSFERRARDQEDW